MKNFPFLHDGAEPMALIDVENETTEEPRNEIL
jgi:hypothetical protein